MSEVKNKKHRRRIKASIRRKTREMAIIVLTIMIAIGIFGFGAVYIVFRGPSQTFSNLVVSTFWETRRGKAVVRLFFNEEEITHILSKNSVDNATVDVSITDFETSEFEIPEDEKDLLTIEDVSGGTWNGKLMTIRDPSRIILGVRDNENLVGTNYLVENYVQAYGAIGGINGGGFDDPNGKGDGSIPQGVVIKDGELLYGELEDWNTIIGFNTTHHLIVGNMTASQALEWGITDAVTFSPILIYNGEALPISGNGGGLNPRTVIGQKADGSVLFLCIDGRTTSSFGATYSDCIEVMLEHGAITAANLDGGSSTVMVYDGEIINNMVNIEEGRSVPTAWLVK